MPVPPPRTSAARAASGAVAWLVLAAVPLWWSLDETGTGNRRFLWGMAALGLGFAGWRAIEAVTAISASRRR